MFTSLRVCNLKFPTEGTYYYLLSDSKFACSGHFNRCGFWGPQENVVWSISRVSMVTGRWALSPRCVRACSVTQWYPTFCHRVDCSPLGSSLHGIFQARILEWGAISFSRGSSQPKGQNCISCISGIAGDTLLPCASWEALVTIVIKTVNQFRQKRAEDARYADLPSLHTCMRGWMGPVSTLTVKSVLHVKCPEMQPLWWVSRAGYLLHSMLEMVHTEAGGQRAEVDSGKCWNAVPTQHQLQLTPQEVCNWNGP